MNENPRHNNADYPPSPSYYQHSGADARDLVTPEYWRDSALVHLFRAGRKPGESVEEAVANAFLCLALWFQSQGLEVPHYSAALAELRAENARLGAELQAAIGAVTTMAMTPRPAASPGHIVNEYTGDTSVASGPCPVAAEVRPTSPTLDTPATSADEWTDEELCEWLTAKWGEPVRMDHDRYRNCIVWPKVVYHPAEKDPYVRWRLTDGVCPWTSSRNIARHFGATKPEPATSDEWTDEGLRAWLDARYKSRPIDVVIGRWRWELSDDGEGRGVYFDPTGPTGPMSEHGDGRWAVGVEPRNMTAREAARILGAVKPADPFAGLLTIETDHDLLDWFEGPLAEITPKAVYVGAIGIDGVLVPAGWYVRDHGDGARMTAREAARTLHRILTEPAP